MTAIIKGKKVIKKLKSVFYEFVFFRRRRYFSVCACICIFSVCFVKREMNITYLQIENKNEKKANISFERNVFAYI